MKIESPEIQTNVPGPGGQPGFLLIVPRNEALDWDIRYEVVSTSRYWMQERQAWWIAAPYLPTAEDIVRRHAPAPPPRQAPAPQLAVPLPGTEAAGPRESLRGRWAALVALVRRSWRSMGSTDSA